MVRSITLPKLVACKGWGSLAVLAAVTITALYLSAWCCLFELMYRLFSIFTSPFLVIRLPSTSPIIAAKRPAAKAACHAVFGTSVIICRLAPGYFFYSLFSK